MEVNISGHVCGSILEHLACETVLLCVSWAVLGVRRTRICKPLRLLSLRDVEGVTALSRHR